MSLKVDMLRVLGISDPTTEQIEVLLLAKKRLSNAELDYFSVCCRWSLGLDEIRPFQYASCQLVELLLEGHLEVAGSMGLEDPEAQVKRVRVFKHMLEVSKLMLIPIRGMNPERVSLLARS